MMKRKYLISLLTLVFGMSISIATLAQDNTIETNNTVFEPTPETNAPTLDAPPDPNDVPIDGGLSILLAVGIGLGAKKYKNLHKKQQQDDCK